MDSAIIFALSVFGASVLGLAALFVYKINRRRREREIFLDRLNDIADKNFRRGLISFLSFFLRTRSKILNRKNAMFLAQMAGAALVKTYVFAERHSGKMYKKWSNIVGGRRFVKGKERVSAFLKDVVDFKDGLHKKDEDNRG